MTTPQTEKQAINLFDVGCLVNLRVGTWSGRKMLTRQNMLSVGINPDALPKDIVNLGRKLLVPKDEIQAMTHLDQRARKYLHKWSVPFGIANTHFVPVSKLPDVEQELSSIKEDFFSKVDSFITRFSKIKEKIKEQHPEFWDKCLKDCYPTTPELLRAKFKFDWYMFKIAGLDSVQEASLEQMMASEQVKQERVDELRTQMQTEVGGFVEEYVKTMRAGTVEFCELMSARVNGTPYGDDDEPKKLTARSLSMFKKSLDKFRQMNIFEDTEIQKMLDEFKDNFLDSSASPDDFDSSHVKTSITTSLAAIRAKAAAEGDNTSQFVDQLKRRIII